ncbi:Bikaverin cluster transcription factor bik5 [Fulvia fulva]|uniref:Bikaverin cluster transcription factor bik5 n=1 Tax=Passalora fulva TaxID=5499 RepID=A0A9Q8LDV6_PASFU|nr:Bikaverin cluster transcription factor bik5 [Fulvia fulva]KAK4628633.1 Bikaverin cluster transcription factor bik5 [Fulvia fulva]UJO15726.1 Bikaverin cluster transcription factor bik5 [Fulvia fulva]WPV29114.1 Bikaverin cluster transcription factor bik5 [Fulvia fulva]
MAEDTPASETSPSSNTVTENPSSNPSAFLAPSDFLPGLPPSTETPSTALGPERETPPAEEGSTEDATQGAAPSKATVDAQGRTLNPRSCVTCRKRKVKCDKLHPCSNCNRAHIECVFPAPGRAPRKVRKVSEGKDKGLLDRLRRLEGVVKGMGVDASGAPTKDEDGAEQEHRAGSMDFTNGHGPNSEVTTLPQDPDQEFQKRSRWVERQQSGRFENRFGRLVVNEGKSRYINNSFWANLSNEVEDLKGILHQSSDEEDNVDSGSPTSQTQVPSNHHGFIFGYSSQNVELLNLHPLPGQIAEYWDIYKDRVDPLCKVLHIPTTEATVLSAASHLSNLSRGFECLLFAIYYGATTSLSAQDCLLKLGEEKSTLLARYRFAIEQALARANFLTTEEIVVLQAFVVFLMCLRRNNDARVIWTLTGLVVRISQTIGIHRDSSHFGLAPFEVEMRRRLWWQVCILDTRASEDHGCDPTIVEQSFDTKMPLNVNDVDITPEMKEFPLERHGCTDMSFCLLRFEVANTFRRISYIPPGPPKACSDFYQSVTLEDKERWITECHRRLEERYLKHCDMSAPFFWVTATVARLMMSKMWLMVYHPFQRQDGGATLSEDVKDKLFITSLENMEYSILLETEVRTMKWGWLFKTYVQWHALAFLLSELCHRTTGDIVERAWVAVEKTRDGRWGGQIQEETNTGHLWRPLKKLYRKAKDARERGLQEEQLVQQRLAKPPTRTYSPNENPMFGHPQKPRMVRAPLSSAQLQRFTEGPTFGQAPLDKHELLRSPKLSQAKVDDPMDTAGSTADILQQPLLQDLDQNLVGGQVQGLNNMQFSMPPNNQPIVAPRAQLRQNAPHFGNNFLGVTGSIDFNDFPNGNNVMAVNAPDPNQNNHMRANSLDTLEDDLNIMDTSGDLNWENWDQLVRQFGMDIESNPAPTGNAMTWNAPNFEMGTNGQNLRMGMGMGGGDWF